MRHTARHTRTSIVIALLCLAALSPLVAIPVRAANRQVVAGGANSGDCASVACGSIAYAIGQAIAGDTISVGAGTYNEHNITIAKNLTITGAGASNTTIDAQLSGRGFYVNAGITAAIANLTVQHGYPGDGNNGGGIDNLGILTLTNATVTGNGVHSTAGSTSPQVPSVLAYGGGIANSGTLTLVGVTVSNNIAGIAGVTSDTGRSAGAPGIYNTGNLNVQGSTLTGNTFDASNLDEYDGGAVYNHGQVTMSNSTITNNRAGQGSAIFSCPNNCGYTDRGGSVVLDHVTVSNNQDSENAPIVVNGDLTLTHCTVTGNTPLAGGYGGGGIEQTEGDFTISDSTVSNNTSGYGYPAGIDAVGSSQFSGTVTITRSVISGNINTGSGNPALEGPGGLRTGLGADVTITDSQVTGNTGITGGVVLVPPLDSHSATINNTTISGNAGTVPSSNPQDYLGAAGLFYSDGGGDGSPTLHPLIMTNSTVSNNTGGTYGGGIYASSIVQITGSTISGNSGDGFVSAVIFSNNDPPPAGTISTVTNSTVSDNSGRGVVAATNVVEIAAGYPFTHVPLVLTNDTVVNNTGGVALIRGAITLKNTLLKNTSYNCSGALTTGGYNLDSGTACFLPGGTDLHGVDPKIDPLANNGGPTPTHSLQLGSPAIDAIPATGGCNGAGLTTDQRGSVRPFGAGCDIGAYELRVDTVPAPQPSGPPAGTSPSPQPGLRPAGLPAGAAPNPVPQPRP